MKKVILIGGSAQHGKDTTAKLIKKKLETDGERVVILHYADFLKNFAKDCLNWNGQKDVAGRTLLQKYGTEVVRRNNPNAWVNMMVELLKGIADEFDYAIIPDTRFPNEIEEMGKIFEVVFLKVLRMIEKGDGEFEVFDNGLTEEQKNHPSETSLSFYPSDWTIINDGDEKVLKENIESLINKGKLIKANPQKGVKITS